jgi:hypothetical protein
METIAAELVETGAKRDSRGRRLAIKAEAMAMIAEYGRSGLTQKAFAEREGIKFFTFTGWIRRYRGAAKPAFAQVRMAKAAPRSELVVSLPNGLVVRGTDAEAMVDLIKRLGC